jgi:mRNA-degrading endonuclease RelE of RelBE toxin-antitoxin system
MNWHIHVNNHAKKQLNRILSPDYERIESTLDEIVINPFVGDIQRLTGQENTWRRRVGTYRIIYELSFKDRLIIVFSIERRTSNTY